MKLKDEDAYWPLASECADWDISTTDDGIAGTCGYLVTIHRARDRRGKLWIATVEILFSVLTDRSQMNKMNSHRIHRTRAKSRKGDILV